MSDKIKLNPVMVTRWPKVDPPAASPPVSTPVKITKRHIEALNAILRNTGAATREWWRPESAAIESLLRSLSDGSRDTFDTLKEVKVPREEALKVYNAMQACGLHRNFLHIIDRWLTPDGEKR